jgi:hypothetical protein
VGPVHNVQIAALIKPFGGRTVPRMLKSNIVREKFIPLRARLLELMEVRQPTFDHTYTNTTEIPRPGCNCCCGEVLDEPSPRG